MHNSLIKTEERKGSVVGKMIFCCIIYVLVSNLSVSAAVNSGVYVSEDNTNANAQNLNLKTAVEKNISQQVMQSYIHIVSDVMSKGMQSAHVNVFPQIAYYAVQEAAYHALKYAVIKDILWEAYNQCMDYTMEKVSEGETIEQIQEKLDPMIKQAIGPIVRQPVFQHIVEKAIEQAVVQYRAVIVQQVAERRARLEVIERRYMAVKQALTQLYEKAIVANMLNHRG